jgi:lysozyme
MRRILAVLAALAALALVVGCGNTRTVTKTVTRTVPQPVVTQPTPPAGASELPLETSRTPEGPGNPTPPKPATPPVGLALAASVQMHISTNGLHLIEGFEGFGSCPYWDPYGHVWTRGYGETEGISGGSACIGRTFGESNLRYRVERYYEWAIRGLHAGLNQNQWDALCSFAWNLGAGIFTGTLRYDLEHHAWRPAASIMLQYVHAGGQVLAGLVTRRRAEVALFLKSVPRPQRTLAAAYAYRNELRKLLDAHHCRPGKPWYGHAKPKTFHTACGKWLAEGTSVNREIRAKGGH